MYKYLWISPILNTAGILWYYCCWWLANFKQPFRPGLWKGGGCSYRSSPVRPQQQAPACRDAGGAWVTGGGRALLWALLPAQPHGAGWLISGSLQFRSGQSAPRTDTDSPRTATRLEQARWEPQPPGPPGETCCLFVCFFTLTNPFLVLERTDSNLFTRVFCESIDFIPSEASTNLKILAVWKYSRKPFVSLSLKMSSVWEWWEWKP